MLSMEDIKDPNKTIRDKKYTYILLDKGESTPSEDENK